MGSTLSLERLVDAYIAGETIEVSRHCTNDSKGEYTLSVKCYPENKEHIALIGAEASLALEVLADYWEEE